jgi:peptidoglycan/xylan/chitin deacetylase (PgdA/CDA1 family)
MNFIKKTVLLSAGRRQSSESGGRKAKLLITALFCILFLCNGCKTINRSPADIYLPDKAVIFTFDDGPNAQGNTTARLLDVLGKYHIRGMFALLGENVEHNPELAKRIHDEGHYLINHGYSDTWAISMNNEEFRANLEKGEAAITAALGENVTPLLYRPQGGYYKKGHQEIWQEKNYTLATGTARIYDAVLKGADKEQAVKKMVQIIERQRGGVILLHDARDSYILMEANLAKKPDGVFNRAWIPDVVEEIIIILLEKGYILNGFDPASFFVPY